MKIINELQKNNLISVIIPVYNSEKYLNRCLKSLMLQSYRNFEIILINDGSTDNSAIICDTWKDKDCRIRVMHQNNCGAAAARNRGLDIAKGDYIMFVDADDYVSPEICEILIEEINTRNDVDCVICGLTYVDDKGDINQPQVVESPEILSGLDAIKDRYILNRNRLNIVGPCGKLFRREIWENLRFTEGLYYEDLDIMPYIFTKCNNVLCIPNIGYYYYQHTGSASHGIGVDNKRLIDSLIIREKHIHFFDELGEKEISHSIRKKLLDLIITSDCNGWIPADQYKYCKKLFFSNYKLLTKDISVKEWFRYEIYSISGARLYKIFKKLSFRVNTF